MSLLTLQLRCHKSDIIYPIPRLMSWALWPLTLSLGAFLGALGRVVLGADKLPRVAQTLSTVGKIEWGGMAGKYKYIFWLTILSFVTCKRPSQCCRASFLSPPARCTWAPALSCSRTAGTRTWSGHRHRAGERRGQKTREYRRTLLYTTYWTKV